MSVLPARADRLRLLAEIRNEAGRALHGFAPLCFPWIRLYRSGRLAWESVSMRVCEGMSRRVELAAGETESRHLTLTAAQILGDSLPEGEYDLELYVPASTRPHEAPRAAMRLSLGRVRLERSRAR